jgi:PAS domain S-box-containing protein
MKNVFAIATLVLLFVSATVVAMLGSTRMAIMLLVLVVLLSVVLYVVFRLLAVRPLFKLKRWVENLPSDQTNPPHFKNFQEMNDLASSFSSMSVNLQNQNAELERERVRLEQLNQQLLVEAEERMRTDRALVESEERYRTLVEASSMMIWTADAEGRSYARPGWLDLTGQTKDEASGEGWLDSVHPDDREKAANAWTTAQKTQTSFESEFRVRDKDEGYRHLVTRGAPIFQDGRVREWIGAIYDVTDRRVAQAALRESEARFRQVTDHIQDVLWLSRDYSQLLYVSPAYETIWGRSLQSLYDDPHSFLEAIHPEDRPHVEETIRREHERGFALEYRVVRPDGSVRWVFDRGFPIKDEQGEIYRVAGIAEDITERKEAEEELRKSLEQIRDLYDSAPCGYHSLDQNGVYVQVNNTELSWLGRTREEVIGKLSFRDVLTEPSQQLLDEKYLEFMQTDSVQDVEYQLVAKDGTIRSVLLNATAARDEAGTFIMSRATMYDITERKRAEELIRRSEEKFAKVFRSSPLGVSVTRISDGTYIEVNEALAKSFGYKRNEMLGRSSVELGLWVDLEQRREVMRELLEVSTIRNRELRFRTKQGQVVIAEFSGELIQIDGEQCLLGVVSDITERLFIEEELKANEALLRQFVKHTPAAIAMFDTDMCYLQVSDRFLTDYNLEGQNIIGKCHYDMFPDLPQRWKDVHKRILSGAEESCEEDTYIAPDGSQGWLQWESLPWRKAGGEIGGLILFTQVITARKRAEQAIKASEERFAKIFNLSPYRMGIVRAEDGVILDVNDCWIRETGFQREEVINRPLLELDQMLSEEARALARKVMLERKPLNTLEVVFKTKSGEIRYATSSVALVDFDGELCFLWAANDITARKVVEEEKRQLIRDLAERVKELTALHQTAGILQDEVKTIPTLLQEIVQFLPPAWQYPESAVARIRLGELEFKTSGFQQTQWLQRAEFTAGGQAGEIEVAYLEEHPGPFLVEEKYLIESVAEMLRSVLNRRFAQEALRESEAVFRTLTETVSAGIFIYRNLKFDYVNPTAERLTGYSRKELLNMGLLDIVAESDRNGVLHRIAGREKGLVIQERYEHRIITKSGDERWMDTSAARTSFRGEPAVIVTTFDITARKRAEEQLRALSAKVQSTREQEGTRIAREIHDELGGALTGLKWDLEGIDSRLGDSNGDLNLLDVRKRISTMTGLIEGTINTVRRISSELRPGLLDDLGLVAAIEWQGQQFHSRTGIEVHWETAIDNVDVGREVATAVFRIFQEVLTNVLRHSQASNVYVKLQTPDDHIELEVRDDGRGITEPEQRNTRSLGLLGMKERALLVGGEVTITGAEGKGTTVVVRVPVSHDLADE